MIDNTPNPKNLNCLQYNENIWHNEDIEKNDKKDKERDVLPFSKHGLKLPKAQNISKNILMRKPKAIHRLRNFRRQVSNYTTSATCTTYNTISTSSTSTSSTTNTSSTSSTTAVSSIPLPSVPLPTASIPVVYNMQTMYEYFNLCGSSNSGFQASFELIPQLSITRSSTYKLPDKLREIVIDGNNIAMSYVMMILIFKRQYILFAYYNYMYSKNLTFSRYRNNKIFAEEGIRIVVEYFQKRGHTVKVFVPHYRRSPANHPLLEKLHTDGIVIFTPSRFINGRRITPYDDR